MADLKTQLILELTDRITRPARQVNRVLDRLKHNEGLRNLAAQGQVLSQRFETTRTRATQLATRIAVLGGAAAGAVWGVERLVASVTDQGEELLTLSNRLGVGVTWMDRWMRVGQRFNVNVDAMVDGIKELSLRADEFAATGSGPSQAAFQRLGLSRQQIAQSTRDVEGLFDLVRKRLQRVQNDSARQRIVDELFGGQGGEQLVELLSISEARLDAIKRKVNGLGGLFTREDAENARRYNRNMRDFTSLLGNLKKTVVLDFLPQLTKRLETLTESLRGNSQAISGRFIGGLKELFSVVRSIGQALSWVADLVGGWAPLLGILAGILGGKLIVSLVQTAISLYKFGKALIPLVGPAIPAAIAGIRALSAALLTTPVGWIVAGIAAIAGAVYLIYKNWGGIADWFTAKIGRVKSAFDDGLLNGVMAVIREFNPGRLILEAINGIIKHFTGIDLAQVGGEFIQSLWDGITARWRAMMGWLKQNVTQLVGWLPDWMTDREGGQASGNTGRTARSGGLRMGPPVMRDTDRPGGAQAQVGGLLRIQIDSDGQPRVRELRQDGGMEIEADTGLIMVSGG